MPTLASPRTNRFHVRRLICGVAILVLYLVIVVAALLAFEDRLLFHPVAASARWIDPPAEVSYADIELRTDLGERLHARWFPHPDANGALIYCHSRAGNLSTELNVAGILEWQLATKSSVLIFDYPGYGRSDGAPSEAGCYSAADAAYDWLKKIEKAAPRSILICGRSLGTAVAVQLAERRDHRALVLVSPMTSIPDVAAESYGVLPARWLMRNQFDSLGRIGNCPQPVFIVHGERDRLVPVDQGGRLFDAAVSRKKLLIVPNAGHGDCVTPEFFSQLKDFLGAVPVQH